jgi:type VI secretion system protein ImpA
MLQFTELLEPISEASPAGEDVTFSSDVDAINQARQFDDPSLDQGEWVTDIKEADWEFVYDNCSRLLAKQSKDLRIAGWLVEAATKTRQLAGMAAGFELMAGLCERFWDALHPQVEDGDVEQRVGNLAWLLTRSVQLVKEVPLTEGKGTAYSLIDFETARARASKGEGGGDENSSQPDISALEAVRRKTSRDFYENAINSATHCQAMLADFERNLDARLGTEGPSFTALKEALSTVLGTLKRFGVDVGLRSASDEADAAGEGDEGAGEGSGTPGVTGPIKTREQALQQLRRVADFFRRTEPHSPVAYLADKAATWGDLPLHTWLKTVVKDPASLAFIEEMLGVKSGDGSGS